ncbi:MAG TPA: MarR family winged helix-turn-helix transcriptional regulator [Phycisphaerales bacterium]|nr:MarR family winged helix-turn-helix transcriptional regulator [Phycisphaerales bacterium]
MQSKLPSPEQVFRQVPCLCGSLLIAARAVSRLYNEELRRAGLEVTQYSILMVLKLLGPVPAGALAERLALDKTTISRNLKVLERNGWVVFERGRDGRERVVSLTGVGAGRLADARPYWNRAQKRMRDALGPDGFDALRARLPDLALATLSG